MKRYIKSSSIYDTAINPRVKTSPNDPFTFQDFIAYGEELAKDYNAPDTKWAKIARNNYIYDVYISCMQCIKPQGFDAKFAPATIHGNLSAFYAQTIRTDEYCPPEWRSEMYNYILDQFTANGDLLTANRYEIITKNGKSYVRDLLR